MNLEPTEQDLARDLRADLELCERAAPPPWHYNPDAAETEMDPAIWRTDPEDGERTGVFVKGPYWTAADGHMTAAARDAWPAALRRAIAAEALLDAYRKAFRAHGRHAPRCAIQFNSSNLCNCTYAEDAACLEALDPDGRP